MFFELHDKSPPYIHYEFIREIFLPWIDPDKYWPEPTSKRSPSVQDYKNTKSRSCKKLKFKRKKNASLTDKTLNPYIESFRCRLNTKLNHLPEAPDTKEGSCAFHYFKNNSKHCKQLMKFSVCQVILCLECYKTFHVTPDLMCLKENND